MAVRKLQMQKHSEARSILIALIALLGAPAILVGAQRASAEPTLFPVEPSMVGVEDAFPVEAGHTELAFTYVYSTAARAFW